MSRPIAKMHICHACRYRARWVVVAPYISRPFFVCGIHRREWAISVCYELRPERVAPDSRDLPDPLDDATDLGPDPADAESAIEANSRRLDEARRG